MKPLPMLLIIIFAISVCCSHGVICGYIFAHKETEPMWLKIVWRATFLAGCYALLSVIVATVFKHIFIAYND